MNHFQAIVNEANQLSTEKAEKLSPPIFTVSDPFTGTVVGHTSVCGFAWVKFAGNTAFGRWAKKQGLATKAYPNGLMIWVSQFGQSMDKKETYAREFASVLESHGITAYAQSRMD
jgi:hypothetical protein